jgi:hypothetical protein
VTGPEHGGVRPLHRARRLALRARFGDLRRTTGIDGWGFGRGTPVDRWYIERYLDGCAPVVRGDVLEVQDDVYGSRLGGDRVTVLDIDPSNPKAQLVGDLCAPGPSRPAASTPRSSRRRCSW